MNIVYSNKFGGWHIDVFEQDGGGYRAQVEDNEEVFETYIVQPDIIEAYADAVDLALHDIDGWPPLE